MSRDAEPLREGPARHAAVPRPLDRIAIERLPAPSLVAVVSLVVIVVLALLDATDGRPHDAGVFGLDNEWTPASAFSALLLLSAAALAAHDGVDPPRRIAPLVTALLFLVMACDEALALHERLESATGIDWQLLYAPVVLAGAIAWSVMLLRVLDGAQARALWVAGAGAWFLAQALERWQWDGDELLHAGAIIPEEMLEMAGSTAWLLALLVHVRRRASRSANAAAR